MRLSTSLAALLLASPALAEAPRVLADTAPVHSLVAMVMEGVGEPSLIVPPGTSPHDMALRPSEAAALVGADLIVWTGPEFLPWLEEALDSLAPDVPRLALLETPGWERLPLREGGAHGHDHGHDEDHGHDHAEEAGHGDEHGHEHEHGDEAGHDHGEDHGHDHGSGTDPHAWLDPAVAGVWLGPIAEALAEADPANAGAYRANAEEAEARLAALADDLRARLSPHAGARVLAGHDAYQYLERATGLTSAGAVADASGAGPSPGDAGALRDAVAAGEVACLLVDAETDPAWAEMLGGGTALRTAAVDPDGVYLEPGPDLYPELIEGLASALEGCLAP